jgi:Tol biopolymer transport system component
MVRASRLGYLIWIALPFLASGCGDGDSSPTAPDTNLTVTAQSEGVQVDADGYTVTVGSSSPTALGVNNSVTITGVHAGALAVTLNGIAPNCAVTGANPLTVQIQSGQHASANFHVVCTATPGSSYRIALMTSRDPAGSLGSWDISVMNSDGSVVALTSPNGFFDGFPTWSPDGQKIAFTSNRDGALNLYVVNQDATNVLRLTTTPAPQQDRFPAWSPDGTKIVFESNRTGSSEIYLMNADGSNVTQLTNNTTGDNDPSFSPDGSKIVFVSNRDAPSTQPPFGKWEVYVMNVDGSAQTRLTSDGAVASRASFFGPTRILFDSDRSGTINIYVVNADGTGKTQLTNNSTTTYLAVGSPDHSRIMFTMGTSTHAEVYTMNPDGTGVTPLTRQQDGVTNLGYSYRK